MKPFKVFAKTHVSPTPPVSPFQVSAIPIPRYKLRVTRQKALPSADVRQAFFKSEIENGLRTFIYEPPT
jgi:hypothetical protein